MWRPSNATKYKLPLAKWPDRQQADAALLFQPTQVGPTELCQRSWIPAMVPWRATENGETTEALFAWYERFAVGQPGAIVVEATGIRDVASGPLLRIGHDRYLPGLRQLVERVKQASEGKTKLFIQLIDFLNIRRRPQREKYLLRYLEIKEHHRRAFESNFNDEQIRRALCLLSDPELKRILNEQEQEALYFGARERVTDLSQKHIRELPQILPNLFANAAQRAEQAGFDGIELHYAHAYTMASFLSARNTRDDSYGGTIENRLRLPLEVYHTVRSRLSRKISLGCRFLSEECIEGGSQLSDSIEFAKAFAKAGMDFLSLSRGGKFEDAKQPNVGWPAYPYTGRSGYECMPTVYSDHQGPFGRNIACSTKIRAALRQNGLSTPIIAAGGICTFDQAEELLRAGATDIIASARQSLADPDWWKKMRLGRGEEIRRCEFTNYCEALDQRHKSVTCKLWDRYKIDEPNVSLSSDGRRRMVAPPWAITEN